MGKQVVGLEKYRDIQRRHTQSVNEVEQVVDGHQEDKLANYVPINAQKMKKIPDKYIGPWLIPVLPHPKGLENFKAELEWFKELGIHFSVVKVKRDFSNFQT